MQPQKQNTDFSFIYINKFIYNLIIYNFSYIYKSELKIKVKLKYFLKSFLRRKLFYSFYFNNKTYLLITYNIEEDTIKVFHQGTLGICACKNARNIQSLRV